MADGEITLNLALTLSEAAARHLKDEAVKLGLSLDAYAAQLLEQQLFDYDDYDWGDDDPRAAPTPSPDPDEPTYSAAKVLAAFDAELEKRLAAKR